MDAVAKKKILAVDDDASVCEFYEHALKMMGYDIKIASSARAAKESIALLRPDLILMDIMMPDQDGISLTRELRADRKTSDIPIIMVSGLADAGTLQDALLFGAVQGNLGHAVVDQMQLGAGHALAGQNLGGPAAHDHHRRRQRTQLFEHRPLGLVGRLQHGVQRGHDGGLQAAQQREQVRPRRAAVDAVLVLYAHHVRGLGIDFADSGHVGAQLVLLDAGNHLGGVVVALSVVHGDHADTRRSFRSCRV